MSATWKNELVEAVCQAQKTIPDKRREPPIDKRTDYAKLKRPTSFSCVRVTPSRYTTITSGKLPTFSLYVFSKRSICPEMSGNKASLDSARGTFSLLSFRSHFPSSRSKTRLSVKDLRIIGCSKVSSYRPKRSRWTNAGSYRPYFPRSRHTSTWPCRPWSFRATERYQPP